MSKKYTDKGAGVSRRSLLKGAAGLAGAAAGATAVTGFPAVWAAEEKVLRYLGTAVNQSDDITKKVKAETGITIQNIVATHRRRDQARRDAAQLVRHSRHRIFQP